MRHFLRRNICLTAALLMAGTFTLGAAPPDDPAANQVRAAMESLKQAMISRDGATLGKLLHEDLMYTHSAGQFERKADVIQSITAGKSPITKLEFLDPTVRVYGNTAFYKGKVNLWHSATDIVHLDVLHVWMKGPDGWRLVARQATRLAN